MGDNWHRATLPRRQGMRRRTLEVFALQGYPKRAVERSISVPCWKTFTGLTKYQAFGQPSLPNGTHDTRATMENMAAGMWSWNYLRWILTLLNFHGGAEETQTLDSGCSACGLGFEL